MYMRRFLFTLIIIMIISAIANVLIAQKKVNLNLKFNIANNDYSFYESPMLKTLNFNVEYLTPDKKNEWIEITKRSKVVDKIDFLLLNDSSQGGQFTFKGPTSIIMLKQYFEELGLPIVLVNDKKVLTKTIITISEAQSKAAGFKNKNFTFTKECNDTTRMDYYDFQVYYAESKLQYMQTGNYPMYLFDGYVSKYTELFERGVVNREKFIKSLNKN